MRFAQGGKFEYGFLSGFVSSLGGTAINNPNMSFGAKVSMAAVIGGTAEKLGGGKFANGAVTGAYVMMFNHLQTQRKVPSKEWIEQKVHEAIEAEKSKIQNWIDGGGGGMEVDFNYTGYDNSSEAFGLYNNPIVYEITLSIGDQEYTASVLYMPSKNPTSNIVTDIKPAGVAGYYGNRPSFKGKSQLFINSHIWGGKQYTPAIIFISKEAYNQYLIYTKDE